MKRNNLASLLMLSATALLTLTACGSQGDGPYKINDIKDPFNTHTETQDAAIKNTKENKKTSENGTKENSKPNQLELTWEVENATDQQLLLGEAKNNLDKIIDLSDDARSYKLDNLKVGTTYYYQFKATVNGKNINSAVHKFTTVDQEIRFINIDGCSNVRDCGGWTGLDGKKIKQGLLYRGNEWNKQNYKNYDSNDAVERAKEKPYGQSITAKGIETVKNDLKIKTECDVRGYETFTWGSDENNRPTECGGLTNGNGLVEGVNYVINPVHTSRDELYYKDYGKAASKHFFGLLADADNNLPMYFHCSQGKDRTGWLAYLFEAFLGVEKQDLMTDYLISNLGNIGGSVSASKIEGGNYNYVDFLDGKEVTTEKGVKYQAEGKTTAERAYNYLLDCGLTENQLDTIRDTFLD